MPRINFLDCSITVFEYSSVWLAASIMWRVLSVISFSSAGIMRTVSLLGRALGPVDNPLRRPRVLFNIGRVFKNNRPLQRFCNRGIMQKYHTGTSYLRPLLGAPDIVR